MQYTENVLVVKIKNFTAKIRKIGIPPHTPVFYIKMGFKGVYISCFPDAMFYSFVTLPYASKFSFLCSFQAYFSNPLKVHVLHGTL